MPEPRGSDETESEDSPLANQPSIGWDSSGQDPTSKEKTGIEAFPAPGTKRIKRGLIVPEDFELPPGYVRHFQATDKGQMLEPILMFHPDYELTDADGNPIPMPSDRVVPADMAPPGLPMDILQVPEDAYAERDETFGDAGPMDEDTGDDESDSSP